MARYEFLATDATPAVDQRPVEVTVEGPAGLESARTAASAELSDRLGGEWLVYRPEE